MNSKRRRHRDGGTFINDADDVVSAMISKMNEAAEVGVSTAAPSAAASLTSVSLAGGPCAEQPQETSPEETDSAAAGGHAPEEVSFCSRLILMVLPPKEPSAENFTSAPTRGCCVLLARC